MEENGFTLAGGKLNGCGIIDELIRNMELGRFEMAYTTLLPCIFKVYLHPEDYARLAGVFGLITEDARRALTARVSKMNNPPRVLGVRRGRPKDHRIAAADWSIQFFADTEDAVPPGHVEIHSELSEVEQPGLRGTKTTLIDEPVAVNGGATRDVSGATTLAAPGEGRRGGERIYADVRYEDDTGPQVFLVTQNVIRIGRGSEDEPMDLALYTNDEVSREHAILRREPATGQFFVTDKSTNGTWVDGRRLKRENEQPLAERAEIKVAEVITLQFQVRR